MLREIRFYIGKADDYQLAYTAKQYDIPRVGDVVYFDLDDLDEPIREFVVTKVSLFYNTVGQNKYGNRLVEPENSIEVIMRPYFTEVDG